MYVMVCRPTYKSIKQSLIPQFRDKILRFGFSPHIHNPIHQAFGGQVPQHLNYKNGSIMFFAGMDRDPDSVLGGEYDIVFYNQVEQGQKDHWEILASRLLESRHGMWTYPNGKRSLLMGDCNPSRKRHWILERARNPENNLELHYMGLEDNPELHDGTTWTQTGLNYIHDSDKTLTDLLKRRGLHGEWCNPEGVVYEYDPKRHDIKQNAIPIDNTFEWSAACDHGGVHPFVFHLYCYPKDRSSLYLYKEIYHTGWDIDQMRDAVNKLLSEHLPQNKTLKWTVADHRPDVNKSLQKIGIRIDNAEKEVLPGIESVKHVLANDIVKFNITSLNHKADPHQKNAGNPIRTVEEFERYSYKDEDKMDGSEKDEYPVKAYDDGMDTLRYQIAKWMVPKVKHVDFHSIHPLPKADFWS